MADTAAHLVDRVFTRVPVRQWVLSLPYALRYRLAYDASLCSTEGLVVMRKEIGRIVVDCDSTLKSIFTPAAAANSNNANACVLCGLDIVGRVSNHDHATDGAIQFSQGRVYNIGLRFGSIDIVGTGGVPNEVLHSGTFQEWADVRLAS